MEKKLLRDHGDAETVAAVVQLLNPFMYPFFEFGTIMRPLAQPMHYDRSIYSSVMK